MKDCFRKILSVFLCVVLCTGFCVPVLAANENNTRGAVFNVKLDTPTISTSDMDQTVTMRLSSNKGVTVDGIGFTVTKEGPLTIASITGGEKIGKFPGASTNLDNGIAGWQSPDCENIMDVTDLAVITFTVPANTPAGTYDVGVEKLELTQDYGEIWENAAVAVTTLTITDESVAEGYTAGVSSLSQELGVDDTVNINVAVGHNQDSSFAAGEIVINYDSSKLKFNQEKSQLGAATVKDNAGVLTLEDYGESKNFGTGVYVLAFEATADGTATVTMMSAAFVNKTDAAKKDLITAAISKESVDLTIHKKTYSVTLPDIFVGAATVEDGGSYTFTLADGENYDYDSISASVNGVSVNVINNGDGSYTIENVTGELVITGNRSEKSYHVVFSGNAAEEILDGADTATYNTDYSFTIPAASGWAYSLSGVTIGGVAYTGYSVNNSVYTIPGSAIKGDIEIIVNKKATEASVTVEGSGAGAAAGYEPKVNIGEDYTLTIVPEKGYVYTVSAKMGNLTAAVIDNGDNTYTIKSVNGNIVFYVEREVIVDGVTVSEYLTLDGNRMWLVKNETTLADGKAVTYDNEKMFWSEAYGAYCYLIIAQTVDVDDVIAHIDITDGDVITVDYGMDVNKTGRVDASDPQLVYNMYNAVYDGFTTDVTMEKYLRADTNHDGKVNVEDSTAIIANILK